MHCATWECSGTISCNTRRQPSLVHSSGRGRAGEGGPAGALAMRATALRGWAGTDLHDGQRQLVRVVHVRDEPKLLQHLALVPDARVLEVAVRLQRRMGEAWVG